MADALAVVDKLVSATNAHDLDALVACFAENYVNETPAHPLRSFRGPVQVRRNWMTIFGAVPDLQARVINNVVAEDRIWSEWEMTGTRRDGSPHAMAGVVIFDVAAEQIRSARFYLEPVESESGDVNAATGRLLTPAQP